MPTNAPLRKHNKRLCLDVEEDVKHFNIRPNVELAIGRFCMRHVAFFQAHARDNKAVNAIVSRFGIDLTRQKNEAEDRVRNNINIIRKIGHAIAKYGTNLPDCYHKRPPTDDTIDDTWLSSDSEYDITDDDEPTATTPAATSTHHNDDGNNDEPTATTPAENSTFYALSPDYADFIDYYIFMKLFDF